MISHKHVAIHILENKEIYKSIQVASLLVMKLMLLEIGHYDKEANKRAFKLNWRWILK